MHEHISVNLVNHLACHKSISGSVTSQASNCLSKQNLLFSQEYKPLQQQYLVFFLSLLTNHLFTSRIWFKHHAGKEVLHCIVPKIVRNRTKLKQIPVMTKKVIHKLVNMNTGQAFEKKGDSNLLA